MTFCGIVETVLAVTRRELQLSGQWYSTRHTKRRMKEKSVLMLIVMQMPSCFYYFCIFHYYFVFFFCDLHWSCFHISYVSIMQCKIRTASTEKDALKTVHANSTDRLCGKGLYQISVLLFLKAIRANKIQAQSNTFWCSDTGFLNMGKKVNAGEKYIFTFTGMRIHA